jgi:hypothetical protein
MEVLFCSGSGGGEVPPGRSLARRRLEDKDTTRGDGGGTRGRQQAMNWHGGIG